MPRRVDWNRIRRDEKTERPLLRREGSVTTHRVTSAPRLGVRWFVRISAVIVGLANLAALPLWLGNPYAMRDDTYFAEAITLLLIAVIAGLVISEVCLKKFELPGRSFSHRS